jgi:hypothetical protein
MQKPSHIGLPGLPRPSAKVVTAPATALKPPQRGTELDLGVGPAGMAPPPMLVHQPGGQIVEQLVTEDFEPWQREFRTLPEEGMFLPGLDPDHPFMFTVGSYTVAKSRTLWIVDYDTGVLMPDPIDPHGYRLGEDGRFSGVMGFRMTVAERDAGDVAYQLEPVPRPIARQEFEPVLLPTSAVQATFGPVPGTVATIDRFARSAAMSFASPAGSGSSLRGPSRVPPGPRNRPWLRTVDSGDTVAVRCTIYRRISAPIAGIYAMIAGYLVPTLTSDAILERMRPR